MAKLSHAVTTALRSAKAPVGWTEIELIKNRGQALRFKPAPKRKLLSDGTRAFKTPTSTVALVFQSEASTQANMAALLGKASVAMINALSSAIEIVNATAPLPRTGKPGRPQTAPQCSTMTAGEIHVVFVCDNDDAKDRIDAVIQLLRLARPDGAPNLVHVIRTSAVAIEAEIEQILSAIAARHATPTDA